MVCNQRNVIVRKDGAGVRKNKCSKAASLCARSVYQKQVKYALSKDGYCWVEPGLLIVYSNYDLQVSITPEK
jgi:hypothetical protein